MNQIVTDTLELIGRQLRLDGVNLETRLRPELPGIVVNGTELQQVISNLLVNARDAVLSEGARSRSICLTTGADSGEVWLTVSDSGPGIAPEALEKIFDPFFTTKPVGKGTGLGLSVSREIVGRHGGSLRGVAVEGFVSLEDSLEVLSVGASLPLARIYRDLPLAQEQG